MTRLSTRPTVLGILAAMLLLFFPTQPMLAQVTVSTSPSIPQLHQGAIAWADYDADGDPDLLSFGRDSLGNRHTYLLKNNGTAFVIDASQSLVALCNGDAPSYNETTTDAALARVFLPGCPFAHWW